MKFFQRSSLKVVLVALVALAPVTLSSVYAGQYIAPPQPEDDLVALNGASLHNPGFDNHIWYCFDERYSYGSLTPTSWMPDDDTAGGPQDWRIWYLDGTVPILTWASDSEQAASTDKAIKSRAHWDGKYHAGVYQIIPNATPCLTYQFQMYGRAKPGDGDIVHGLQVGIDRVGYYPSDVAVHNFPNTTVWGTSHPEYTSGYGLLSVTAEAWGDTITAFTYADIDGGEVLWDTGSFQEIVPSDLISDPDNPPGNTNGVINYLPPPVVGSTSATVNWNTTVNASSQVYYRLISTSSTPISSTGTLSYTTYLPLVSKSPAPWRATTLDTTPTDSHTVYVSNLLSGSTYEYVVASRGYWSGGCVTWATEGGEFTTNP
jgi:hypothetical protein